MTFKRKIMAITPLCCLIIFLLLGFVWGYWHPGWIIFFMIPVMPFLLGLKKIRLSIPLVIVILYLILGFAWGLWHPGWIILLFIPVFEILFKPSKKDKDDDDIIDV